MWRDALRPDRFRTPACARRVKPPALGRASMASGVDRPKSAGTGRLLLRLTTPASVASLINMKAVLVFRQRVKLGAGTFKEIVIWRLPRNLPGSDHPYKYRMALIEAGMCVLRYDNEAGKGDHSHIGDREEAYGFTTIEQLLDDFDASVRRYLDGHTHHR